MVRRRTTRNTSNLAAQRGRTIDALENELHRVKIGGVRKRRVRRRRPRRMAGGQAMKRPGDLVVAPSNVAMARRNNMPVSRVTVPISDRIGSITVSDTTTTGSILYHRSLNPLKFPNTHMSALASAYDLYKWTNLRVEISAKLPTTVGGGYVAAIIADPTVNSDSLYSLGAPAYLMAHPGAVSATYWSPCSSINYSCKNSRLNSYYTASVGADEGVSDQCALVVVADSPLVGLTAGSEAELTVSIRGTLTFSKATAPIAAKSTVHFTIAPGNAVADDQSINVTGWDDMTQAWTSSHYGYGYYVYPSITADAGQAVACAAMAPSGASNYWAIFKDMADCLAAGTKPTKDKGTCSLTDKAKLVFSTGFTLTQGPPFPATASVQGE